VIAHGDIELFYKIWLLYLQGHIDLREVSRAAIKIRVPELIYLDGVLIEGADDVT
jgi:hypothetical protein